MSFRIITKLGLLLTLTCLPGTQAASGSEKAGVPLVIRYPTLGEEQGQTRPRYFLELLELALEKSGLEYELKPVVLSDFRESRSVMSVAKGLYDIHWMNTNPRREEVLRPIRVPLFKGVIGWRLLMVRAEDRDRFDGMVDLSPLRALKAVQGHDWPDSEILGLNGLDVIRTPHWEGMFRMLYAGRVDYFPRSLIEIWDERDTFAELDLAVDPHVVLHYPAAYYFFVRRDDTELASAIERGLLSAVEDGSFDRVFMAHFGEELERASLHSRRVIRLNNPLLTEQTPLDRAELWYQP